MNAALLQTQQNRVASKANDIREIAFIDSRVGDIETLLAGVRPGVKAIVLDPNRNGIEQIGEVLDRYGDLRAIHLVAHGQPGGVQLGNGWLRWDRLEGDRAALARWFGSDSAPPDLLIYGCNVAQGAIGAAFVRRLSEITGANVAASATRTGNAGLGGDWNLEVTVGEIATPLAFGESERLAYGSVLPTITVTNTNDSGAGSLRQAISDANSGDTIDLTGLSGTIQLTTGQLEIDKDLIITGPGPGQLTIEGTDPTDPTVNSRLFLVSNTASAPNVTISGLTLTGGRADDSISSADGLDGGAINYEGDGDPNTIAGTLTVENSIIDGNSAVDDGGGIHVARGGTLKISDTIIRNNESEGNTPGPGVDGGGGLGLFSARLNANNITVENNEAANVGGGIFVGSDSPQITNSIIKGNDATNGAGIWNDAGTLTLQSTTVESNIATNNGGGIYNRRSNTTFGATIVIDSSTSVKDNTAINGGGIYNAGNAVDAGTIDINGGTVSGNNATTDGGGIYNTDGGTVTVDNGNIFSNSATSNGGGIRNTGDGSTVTINTSNIGGSGANTADNGGGIYNDATGNGEVSITKTTLDSNTATTNGGGVFNDGQLSVTASTFDSNQATNGGGVFNEATNGNANLENSTLSGNSGDGINNAGTITITNNTITQNTGNGIVNTGTADVNNAIVAGNDTDVDGNFNSNGANIIGDVGGSSGFGGDTDLAVEGIALSAVIDTTLGNNGGSTQTHALVSPTSIAIDRGEDLLTTDQNGKDRLLTVDVGAVEDGDIEINVKIDSGNILDDTGSFGFGDRTKDSTAIQTFTIENQGDLELDIDPSSLSLPTGFSLVGGFPDDIAANSSATFQIQLDTSAVNSFSGQLSFDNNDVDESTYNFTIDGNIIDTPNQDPAIDIDNQIAAPGTAVTFQPTASDPDGDDLTFSATINGTPIEDIDDLDWLTFDSDTGQFSGTPPADLAGETFDIQVKADDGNAGTAVDTFQLEIGDVGNNDPVLDDPIEDLSLPEGESLNFNPGDNFSDPDGDDLTFSATFADGSPLPAWINFNEDTGELTADPPDGIAIETLDIKIVADDGNGGEPASDTFSLTVGESDNTEPTTKPLNDQNGTEGTPLSFTIPDDTFTDPDGDPLDITVQLANGEDFPEWLDFDADTGTFSGTPPEGSPPDFDIQVKADDGNGGQVTSSFTLSIADPTDSDDGNDPPVLDNPVADRTIEEGDPLNFTVPADTFSDPDGDPLTYTATLADGSPLPNGLTFDPDTRTFSGTPAGLQALDRLSLKVTADDGNGGMAMDVFDVSVNTPGNNPPTIDDDPDDQTGDPGDPLDFDVPLDIINDTDTGDDPEVTATLANGDPLPPWLNFDPDTGKFTGEPPDDAAGETFPIQISADDGNGGITSKTFDLTIGTPTDSGGGNSGGGGGGFPNLGGGTPPSSGGGDDSGDGDGDGDGEAPPLNLFQGDTPIFGGDDDGDGDGGDGDGGDGDGDGGFSGIDFGSSGINDPLVQTLTLENPGNEPVSLSDLQLPEGFSLVGEFPETIPPGGEIEFQIQLDADATGNPNGLLSFVAGDGTRFEVPISGTVLPFDDREACPACDCPEEHSLDLAQPNLNDAPFDRMAFTQLGNDDSDIFIGSVDGDNIQGFGGDDILTGGIGADIIRGGKGSDVPIGSNGDRDMLFGNQNNDWIFANEGEDTVHAGQDNDNAWGGKDNDMVIGDRGDDILMGDLGDDTVVGGTIDEVIRDTDGTDMLMGGGGRDLVVGNEGNDTLSGGDDDDTLHGGQNDDRVMGDAGHDLMFGDIGNDSLSGGEGSDTLIGSNGKPQSDFDRDRDFMMGDAGDDLLLGNEGSDTLKGGDDNDLMRGGRGDDQLFGDSGHDLMFGDLGDDTLCAHDGDDTLLGSNGNPPDGADDGSDVMLAGAGDDLLLGNEGDDTLDGGEDDDTLHGGRGNDRLEGNSGNDAILGDLGNDTIDGGEGDDTIVASNGGMTEEVADEADVVSGGAGDDWVAANRGNDVVNGGQGDDTLYGGQEDDSLTGGIGDDLLYGDLGDDTVTGGNGSDRFVLTPGGTDTIVDFEDGIDAFVLTGELTFAQLDITVNETSEETADETSVSLSFNEEVIAIVQGVGEGVITADDFVSLESD